MKKIVYNIVAKIVKLFSGDKIVGKKIRGMNKVLYYERAQHLTFFLRSSIDYERDTQNIIREYIRKGDTVFDIGANIGQYAIPFSELVGDFGKVYSFEPDYKNFSFLQFNVNINKCQNITCLNYGLGKDNTQMSFFRDTQTGGRKGSFRKEFVGKNYEGYTEYVTLKNFDTAIELYGKPHFVKVDVEGFEKELLEGLTSRLDSCTFLIEVREETKKFVFDYFDMQKYQCFLIDKKVIPVSSFSEIPSFANLIFTKNNTQRILL